MRASGRRHASPKKKDNNNVVRGAQLACSWRVPAGVPVVVQIPLCPRPNAHFMTQDETLHGAPTSGEQETLHGAPPGEQSPPTSVHVDAFDTSCKHLAFLESGGRSMIGS